MNATPYLSRPLGATPVYAVALRAHVRACDRARGRVFALRCVADHLHDLVGARFFTTVVAATSLLMLLVGCA